MMKVYSELARETRQKRFAHTEIERIRINTLRQMRQASKASVVFPVFPQREDDPMPPS